MSTGYYYKKFPRSRIATIDVYSIGQSKHHVVALLEFDVTDNRNNLKLLRREGNRVSFNGWIVKTIASVIHRHKEASAFLFSKRKLIVFEDVNVSFLVEKKIGDERVPIPLVIEKAQLKSLEEITSEIQNAVKGSLNENEIVINKQSTLAEKLYYFLPSFMRKIFWMIFLSRKKFAFAKMGNVAITSVGMIGKINGWFIHRSIHPIAFGIGSVLRKPVVVKNEIRIRDVLNMTVLMDHDVIDGAAMVRFLNDLTRELETVND